LILCKNLSRTFDEDGVFDIDLRVEKGQALGLLGPAGAGKSLLLRVLSGQLRADMGEATVFGLDCWLKRHETFKKMVYIPVAPALEPGQTGEQTLNFYASYHGGFNPEKARRLTEKLDITLTGANKRSSTEARKKLGLLCGLSLDANVYLLDEPFNGLSANAKNAVLDFLLELRKAGAAILLTSHVLEEVRRSCSHVAIIRKGRLVVTQPVEALSLTRQKVYHITFKSPDEAAAFAAEWEAATELIGSRALVAIPASPQTLLRTLARYEVVDLIGGREEAEEGFLRFYGDDIV
jgi:ABC-type multidrug transport system ATPase subunit